jgi:DNA-directed RNA polymerase subunit F
VEKARKALEGYQHNHGEAGERFKTQAAALEYLQRTYKIEKSKLSKDVNDGRVPRKDGGFYAKDLDYYANADRLETRNSIQVTTDGLSDDIKRETARKLRIQNEEREGQLINKAEEEARDAKLWAAIKSDLENHAPAIVHELINRILPIVPDDDLKARVLALGHDLRLTYEDAIADIFDRYAKNGGMEA